MNAAREFWPIEIPAWRARDLAAAARRVGIRLKRGAGAVEGGGPKTEAAGVDVAVSGTKGDVKFW